MRHWYHYFIPSIQDCNQLRKLACIFAGLGHLQPLLLATTNSHYLLDRFCVERCCSSDYISRIVTSIIFMEILSIIVVRIVLIILPTGLRTIMTIKDWRIWTALNIWTDPSTENASALVSHTENEEFSRGIVGSIILCFISLGYLQILYAFTTGGKKGHMHWFYSSLLVQHFLNSLIAGSIGFWEVGLALWYLVTLPMAPIVVFFYQLIIHSLIRNNGPRDAEYIVVENQIWLALLLSCIATTFWILGYVIPYEEAALNLADPDSSGTHITKTTITNLKIYTVNGQPASAGQSATLTATISAKDSGPRPVSVTIHSITVTLNTDSSNPIKVYPVGTVTVKANATATATVKATVASAETKGAKTLTIIIDGKSVYEKSVNEKASTVTIDKIALEYDESKGTVNVDGQTVSAVHTVKGYTCYPEPGHYISSVTGTSVWTTTWDGGKCYYAECYGNGNSGTNPALAVLYVRLLGGLDIRYYGRDDTSGTWRVITSEALFKQKVKELVRTGSLSPTDLGQPAEDPKHNTNYKDAFSPPTWAPLFMQGLSVGAVGSIFPNLIPKTLTCPKTTRTLSVINMFLVTVPHIFNVMLGDMDLLGWIGAGDDWLGSGWHYSLLLYIIYILAILFAIFNIHYPEWRLSTFLRNNTWFVFLMILFTDVLNETFNAISRAGICSQRSAHTPPGQKEKAKNHPCLHNKIACLMNLTYIPFWLTTTPMMIIMTIMEYLECMYCSLGMHLHSH